MGIFRKSKNNPANEDAGPSASSLIILAGRLHGDGAATLPETPSSPKDLPGIPAEDPRAAIRPDTRDDLEAVSDQFNRLNNAQYWRRRFMAIGGPYIVFIFLLAAGSYLGYRFYRHQKWVAAMREYERKLAEINSHRPQSGTVGLFQPVGALSDRDMASVRQSILMAERQRIAGHTVEAIATYRRVVDFLDISGDPGDQIRQMRVSLHNRIGVLYGNIGNYNEAASEFHAASQLSPKDASIIRNYGVAQIGQVQRHGGSVIPAIASLKTAIKLDPKDPQTYRALAVALKISGDLEGAAQQNQTADDLQKAASSVPTFVAPEAAPTPRPDGSDASSALTGISGQ